MEDFTYDYSNLIKQNYPIHDDERFDKLIKSYLFTHQFSIDVNLTRKDVLLIIEYFLEENEYVFENNDKLLLVLNTNNSINKIIDFLNWLFSIISIKIVETKIISGNQCGKINLMLKIKNYENTINGKRIEEYNF